jgi:DNA-binding PadR family transcriptional regulator
MTYAMGRWSEPGLLVLASLAEGDKHGYAMVSDIDAMSGVRLGPGTLYGALARLEEQGLVEALPLSGRRRPYRLTGEGARVLGAQLDTLARVADTGLTRLRAAGALGAGS